MSAGRYNIVIDQGSTFVVELLVKEGGAVFDLTGYNARAVMKASPNASTVAATFTCTILNPVSDGKLKLELSPSSSSAVAPGLYVYDLEIHTANNVIVKRLIEGTVNIAAGITVGASA